jgi:hypothetical protein
MGQFDLEAAGRDYLIDRRNHAVISNAPNWFFGREISRFFGGATQQYGGGQPRGEVSSNHAGGTVSGITYHASRICVSFPLAENSKESDGSCDIIGLWQAIHR